VKRRDEILDMVRGVSALAVLAAHIRAFVFRDLGELQAAGLGIKAFYFITGVHHQAVMVFFVLSGYFVGGAVLKSLGEGRFSWARYALARLSRLWVALIPALVLTALCDFVVRQVSPEADAGRWHHIWMSGPDVQHRTASDMITFAGNIGFLQTIEVPVFGSNGPLWSLANEFWYYVGGLCS